MNLMEDKFWKDRRVFVTGATGFIGSWLVRELLKHGAYVVVLVRDIDPQSELYRSGDIGRVHVVSGFLEDFLTLQRAIVEHETTTVFHLGAQTLVEVAYRFPLQTFESNIRGTYNLLEACRIHRDIVQQIVIASSDKAYGEKTSLPYTEDMSLEGRYPYDVSKSCTDLIAQSYYYTYNMPVAIARCGNVYGGGDLNWSRIVPGTIRSFLFKQNPIIRSDGTYRRDYIYVKDVVRAYMLLAQKLDLPEVQGQAFNFSTEKPLAVLEIVSIIQKLMNAYDLEPKILNYAKAEIRDQFLCSKKAREVLNWQPQFDIEAGITETIDWYRKFFESKYGA